jgi:hypothetical protein
MVLVTAVDWVSQQAVMWLVVVKMEMARQGLSVVLMHAGP